MAEQILGFPHAGSPPNPNPTDKNTTTYPPGADSMSMIYQLGGQRVLMLHGSGDLKLQVDSGNCVGVTRLVSLRRIPRRIGIYSIVRSLASDAGYSKPWFIPAWPHCHDVTQRGLGIIPYKQRAETGYRKETVC